MILVGLYFWYPCNWIGSYFIAPPDPDDKAMRFATSMIGLLFHLALFVLFLLCGGHAYFPNCGGH